MYNLYEKIEFYSKQYRSLTTKENKATALPGKTYFLEDGSILCIPRDEGDNRFPYGENGFNFWTYASGYMHANDGLFSPFLRAAEGQEPKIAFFVGWKGETKKVLSLLSVPVLDETEFSKVVRYTIFTRACTYYITEIEGMKFGVRVYVDGQKKMYFSVAMVNEGNEKQQLFFSSYMNPYLSHSIYESSEDRWFRKCEFVEMDYKDVDSKDLGKFVFTINEDLSRTESISNFGVINQKVTLSNGAVFGGVEATTSRKQYVGGGTRNLNNAEALLNGRFSNANSVTSFTDVAIAGELCHIELPKTATAMVDFQLSYITNSHVADEYRSLLKTIDSEEIERLIAESEYKLQKENQTLTCRFEDETDSLCKSKVMTQFFDVLKKQVEFCSLIKGYVQLTPNSLIGIRDVFQAIEGMLFYKPKQARNKMLEALSYIDPTGRCPRQYGLAKNELALPPMDLRQFIDQGCWVISTISTYLKFTGDFEFLNQNCGYLEIIDDKKKVVKKSELVETVLIHMLRIMDYLIRNQDEETGCIKILYGDWNDALDGLGVSLDTNQEFGNGVSVMATLQVYQNLEEMIELLSLLGGYEEQMFKYRQVKDTIEAGLRKYAVIENESGSKRIVHGWGDKQSYYVGSFCDPDNESRYGLTSNAFWVIGGLYKKEPSIRETIFEAYKHLDSKYGLKTFEPCFYPNAKGVGRIYKLPPGTAENGATYIHATAFAVMALFMMGEAKQAWEQLIKILPFTHEKIFCSPYVMPNSYGLNSSLNIDGESMQDWQTGSSNVVFKTIIRFVIGFQPEYDGITIQPAAWIPFEKYDFTIQYRGKNISIRYRNANNDERKFWLNGVEIEGTQDEFLKTKVLHLGEKQITDGLVIDVED